MLEAQGSVLTNKYAEGYPGKRYYGGCEYVDEVERLAIERACKLFDCAFANVQPHSGANANQAVFMALLQPGDTFMGMDLAAGGHLTHGSPANQSGKWFKPVAYTVRRQDHLIDYDALAETAEREKPKLIIAGGSAYSRHIDFKRFREIADSIGAYLMVDMAHFAGLVAGGVFPSPLPHAHIVTTTTHKTLRGPRGGMVLSTDEELGKKINSAVFPGLQGGPLMHVIAAKAVAFGEALAAGVQDLRQGRSSSQRQGAGRHAGEIGRRDRLWRHRQPPDAGGFAAQRMSPARRPKPRSAAPTSPATRTACRSIPSRPSSLRACAWALRPAPRAASAKRNSSQIGEMIARVVDGLAKERRREQRRCRGRCEAGSAGPDRPFPHLWVVMARISRHQRLGVHDVSEVSVLRPS